MQISLGQDKTAYHGRKEKVAVVILNGNKINLGLGDTSRIAQSEEAAKRTLKNLAARVGEPDWEPNGEAAQLTAHCRELLGMKPTV